MRRHPLGLRCIEALGADITIADPHTLRIRGGLAPRGRTLYVGESGLSTRLFTPIAALTGVPLRIEGTGTLLGRPMEMMIAPLRQLGVAVTHRDGRLPFDVCGPLRSATVEVDGSVSSQFLTACSWRCRPPAANSRSTCGTPSPPHTST